MRDKQPVKRIPSLLSMLWRAATGVSTITALVIVLVAPGSIDARIAGGAAVLLVVLGVVVFYLGLREGHRIGLESLSEEAAHPDG